MPVQFYCPQCRQLLSVGLRKVGSPVNCPKCRRDVLVPSPEAAAASLAMVRGTREAPPVVSLPEFAVYDEQIVDAPPQVQTRPPSAPSLPRVPDGPAKSAKTTSPATRSLPGAASAPEKRDSPLTWTTEGGSQPMLLVSRRVLYFQAALFALVAVAAFGIGYLTGYGTTPGDGTVAGQGDVQPVVVQGRLLHATAGGENRGDAGAVILVLPEDRQPEPKLPIDGLRPEDPLPADGDRVMLALEELGGVYQRAGADGSYSLTVPAPGKYFVCFISRQTARPANTPPLEFEMALLNRYFDQAEQLVGQHKYRFRRDEFTTSPLSRSHNFEQTGQP